jgi:hypothetical protein
MPNAAAKVEAHGPWLRVTSPAGIVYDGSTSARDGLLEQFFRAYDSAFVLANEKEGLTGFAECLALNEGCSYRRLRDRYGPFREFVVVARGGEEMIGGLNFIVFPVTDPDTGRPSLSVNLNYVFVQATYRRRGMLKTMVGELPSLALALFGHTNAAAAPQPRHAAEPSPMVYIFIEQNDPYRLSAQDYALDTAATGLDQLARIGLWARQGAKIVDFAYVQPALAAGQAPDHNLVFAVLGARTSSLSPALLRHHLERFFAISVLKGGEPAADAEARRQLAHLAELAAAGARINLLELKQGTRLPEPGGAPTGERLTLRRVLTCV